MSSSLTADERSKARKVAAMLGSPNQGEQINALAILNRMARAHRLTVDQFIASIGTAPERREPVHESWRPRPGRTSAKEGGDYDYTDATYTDKSTPEGDRLYAEQIRRAHEAAQERRAQARQAKASATEQIIRAKQASAYAALRTRMRLLYELDVSALSAWEHSLVNAMMRKSAQDESWRPTPEQDAIINQILERAL